MKKRYLRPRDIRVGTIGYGGSYNMGHLHLSEMARAGMTPAAVCDVDPARAAAASEEFPGVATYTSVAKMLREADLDVVAIITPHNTHARLAVQCLRAGVGVCCEKPFAITTAECDRMIRAAEENSCLLSTYHNRHWDGGILRAMREVVQKGSIGEIVRIQARMNKYQQPGDIWRTSRTISGGVLYDWGVHLLEYSLQLMGEDAIREVSAFAHNGFWAPKTCWGEDTNEDEATAVVRFASGRFVALSISEIDSADIWRGLEITGTRGTYYMSPGQGEWKMIVQKKTGPKTTEGKDPVSEGWRFYQNIAEHLVKGEKLVITPQWARRPIHILDLATRSVRNNRAVRAKYE